jgi:ABC-type arginine/histidine transport system permease subunit
VVEPTAGHVIVLGAGVLLLFVILALVPWRWEVTGGLLLVVMSVIVGVTYAIASAAIVRQDGSRLPFAVRVITTVVFTGSPLVAGTLFLVHHRSLAARA